MMNKVLPEVNEEERKLCERRGHGLNVLQKDDAGKWSQCKYCGVWIRSIVTTEERIYPPPIEERSRW